MTLKHEITKLVLETAGLPADEDRIQKTIPTWWVNPRKKEKGGLRLTEQGFNALKTAGIQSYKIRFEAPITCTNQEIIRLDQLMDSPYYITNREVHVFKEKMAIQLVLFSGNILKFINALANRQTA